MAQESLDKFKRLFSSVKSENRSPVNPVTAPASVPTPPEQVHVNVAQTTDSPEQEKESPVVKIIQKPPVEVNLGVETPDWFHNVDRMKAIEWANSVVVESGTQVSEEIRALRTNLWTIRLEKGVRSIAITSCRHNEGKTTLAINLAMYMAKHHGRRVLLIDGDLRRPKLKSLGNMKPDLGFDDLLQGRCELGEVVRYSERDNLYFIPTVRGHSNASELLELPRMREVVKQIYPVFDYVIYDAPPILSTTDPVILGRLVDGVIMAVKANSTQRESVEHAQTMMEQVKINILGMVLTQMRNFIPRYLYRYQYYHDYYHYYYTKTKR